MPTDLPAWKIYCLSPIDWHWDVLPTLQSTVLTLEYNDFSSDGLLRDWESVKRLARESGWEGDLSQGPVVFWLPSPDGFCFEHAFAFKQWNNGETFVAVPQGFPLPWLVEIGA